ncbi:MAG: hypothetical protein AAGH65_12905 [Pseudomonadota bacterium]
MTIDDRELDRRLTALDQRAAVDDHLWTKIEPRLSARSNRSWIGAVAAAACFLAVVFITHQNAPNWSEVHHQQALQAEVRALNASSLMPQLIDQIEWSDDMRAAWDEYQVAINDLEQALELNPGYQMLVDTLAATKLQQSRLVNRAVAMHIQVSNTLPINEPFNELGANQYEL